MSNASDLGSLGMPVAGVAVLDVGGILHADLNSTVGIVVFAAAVVVGLALIAGLALIFRVFFVRLFRAEQPSSEPIWLRVAIDLTSAPTDPRPAPNRSTWLRQPAGRPDLPQRSERHTP